MKRKQQYYYGYNNYNKKIKYLADKNIITKDGIFNIVSGHCPKQKNIMKMFLKSYKDIQFKLITNINFDVNLDNLIIIDK